jgi:hypothetical protein
MKLLETKQIELKGKFHSLKKCARAYLKFLELTGRSIDKFDNSIQDGLYFFYACLWGAGSRISWDEFLDLIEDVDVNDLIITFANLMSESTEKKAKAR